jgi:hypothetical protein
MIWQVVLVCVAVMMINVVVVVVVVVVSRRSGHCCFIRGLFVVRRGEDFLGQAYHKSA